MKKVIICTHLNFIVRVSDDGAFLESLRCFPELCVMSVFTIGVHRDDRTTYAFHPVQLFVSLEHIVEESITNIMICSADIQSPIMLWSDNDSVLRDILSVGQDPRGRAVPHPVTVFLSADLRLFLPFIPRPATDLLLYNTTSVRSPAGK